MLERHLEPTRLHRRVHVYTVSHLLKLYVVVNCSRGLICNFMVQLAMTQASNQAWSLLFTFAAERRVYFSISKSENSHADNTYEETFCTNELDSSRRHSEWQQQQTLCVVSSGNVSERLRTKHHSQLMRSAFHTLCR